MVSDFVLVRPLDCIGWAGAAHLVRTRQVTSAGSCVTQLIELRMSMESALFSWVVAS